MSGSRALKIKKICFSPKVPIQPYRPKSYSAPSGVICVQNSPIKRLVQPTLGSISALGSKSALVNWTVLAMIKGTKLDSKIGLYFIHRKGSIFRAKTYLSDSQCIVFSAVICYLHVFVESLFCFYFLDKGGYTS